MMLRLIFLDYLMGSEARVVQFLDSVLHILSAEKLDDAGAILEDVSEAHIPSLAHVVLQILPAPRRRQS